MKLSDYLNIEKPKIISFFKEFNRSKTKNYKPYIKKSNKKPFLEFVDEGDGKNFPETGALVSIQYEGYFENGMKFDSSNKLKGKILEFPLGSKKVIKGFN